MQLTPLPDARRRRLRALLTRPMREKYREFIVEGPRSVREALQGEWRVEFLCVSQSGRVHLDSLPEHTYPTNIVGDDAFEEFSTTEHSQGIVALVRQQTSHLSEDEGGLFIALDRVGDPGNVGTIIRSADWFGARGVVLGIGCAELFNPKTVRSTMGSIFHIPVIEQIPLAAWCAHMRSKEYVTWCADMGGEPVSQTMRATQRAILVIGSEAHGIDPGLCAESQAVVGVPRIGSAESLNAASAAAALLALLRA